jgi:hypothetical protein
MIDAVECDGPVAVRGLWNGSVEAILYTLVPAPVLSRLWTDLGVKGSSECSQLRYVPRALPRRACYLAVLTGFSPPGFQYVAAATSRGPWNVRLDVFALRARDKDQRPARP